MIRLPGLHSLHWKVFIFHLAVLFLPVAYLGWQVRLNLEATQLRATEEGMIDTAAVVGELYARVAAQAGGDAAKMRESFAQMFVDFESNRSTKARLFGFSKEDADTRIVFYDPRGAILYDTQNPGETGFAEGRQVEVWQALQGRYGSRWAVDSPGARVNLFSTLPVWSGAQIAGAVTIVKPTVRSRIAIIRALRDLLVPGLAAIAMATLLAYVLSAYLTGIVGGLAERAERIAAGEAGVVLETWTRSEIGSLARAVEKMRQRLEGKAYVEEMATNLSHELKTPLAAIRGAAEVLEDGAMNDPAARAKFLGAIQLEASRLNRIVDNLLELSRIETSPPRTGSGSIDLREVLNDSCTRLHAARAERRALRFSWRVPEVPVPARISREHFEQVLGNLVSNAFQFTPEGKAVEVSLRTDSATGQSELRVRDEGCGIEEAIQPRIFDRFFTTVSPRSGQRGTGLGLALVKSIVESHAGCIAMRSTPGEGSEFTVRLPRV